MQPLPTFTPKGIKLLKLFIYKKYRNSSPCVPGARYYSDSDFSFLKKGFKKLIFIPNDGPLKNKAIYRFQRY